MDLPGKMWEPSGSECFIYAVRVNQRGPIKIGMTRRHPRVRVAQLQQATPFRLALLGFYVAANPLDEVLRHEVLTQEGRCRMRGEWYRNTPDSRFQARTIAQIGRFQASYGRAYMDPFCDFVEAAHQRRMVS